MGGCQNYGPFWVPDIVRHLIFRVPEKAPYFDNHPHDTCGHEFPESLRPELVRTLSRKSYTMRPSTGGMKIGRMKDPFLTGL